MVKLSAFKRAGYATNYASISVPYSGAMVSDAGALRDAFARSLGERYELTHEIGRGGMGVVWEMSVSHSHGG